MFKLNKTKKTFLIFLSLTFICGGTYFFFFNQIKEINLTTSEEQNRVEGDVSKEAVLGAVKEAFSDSRLEISKLDTYFVGKTDEEYVGFVEMIESLGKQNNLIIDAGRPPVSKQDAFFAIGLDVHVQGEWQAIMQFVSELETLPYKVNMNKISFTEIVPIVEKNGKVGKVFWSGTITASVLKLDQ